MNKKYTYFKYVKIYSITHKSLKYTKKDTCTKPTSLKIVINRIRTGVYP